MVGSTVGSLSFVGTWRLLFDLVSHINGPFMTTATATPIDQNGVPFSCVFKYHESGSAAVRAVIGNTELERGLRQGANSTIRFLPLGSSVARSGRLHRNFREAFFDKHETP
jgi:hypothetical protein